MKYFYYLLLISFFGRGLQHLEAQQPAHNEWLEMTELKATSGTLLLPVNCDKPPLLVVPEDYQGCPGENIAPVYIGGAIAHPGLPACPQPDLAYRDSVLFRGSCGDIEVKRTWTATDPNNPGLVTTGIQYVRLIDTIAPEFVSCPPDITVRAPKHECEVSAVWTPPFASDNCYQLLVETNHYPGDIFRVGDTEVKYVATDQCGNSDTCSFIVTVLAECCSARPFVYCPDDYLGCPGDSTSPKKTKFATGAPGDVDCNAPVISFRDHIVSNTQCNYIIHRTWYATDPLNDKLKDSCVQKVILKDDTSPWFSKCPNDITVASGADCTAEVTWQEPVAKDNCGIRSVDKTHAPGSVFPIGKTEVIYTATDNCGHTAQCSFTIMVTKHCCTEPPVLTLPADYTGCPGTAITPFVSGSATAKAGSRFCSTPEVTFKDSVLSIGPCTGQIKVLRTWYAKDPDQPQLHTSGTQVIELKDDTVPWFSKCPNDITVASGADCTAEVTWQEPVAKDNCGIRSVDKTHAPGSVFPVGQTEVTYSATDNCGHTAQCSFTITVTKHCCTEPPVLTLPADYTGCPGTAITPSVSGSATAKAGSRFCSTPEVTFKDSVLSIGPCTGQIKVLRTWYAKDPDQPQLHTSGTQVIELKDDTSPWFSKCPNDITVASRADCTAEVTWQEPVAKDNCGIRSVDKTHAPGSVFPVGQTEVTYSATDNCGHTAQCSFTITVTKHCCTEPPVLTLPADYTGCPGTAITPSVSGSATAKAGSRFCSTPEVTFKDSVLSIGPCTGQIKVLRTWYAKDPDQPQLHTSGTQVIELKDDEPPVFVRCPNDITISANEDCQSEVSWEVPEVQDNCSKVRLTSNYHPGDTFPAGTTVVEYTAKDACGNESLCSFSVTIQANGITIICPDDVVVAAPYSEGGTHVLFPRPSATLCDACLTDTVRNKFVYMGTYRGHKYFCSRFQKRWPEARKMAEDIGGYLAVIEDEEENRFIASKLMGTPAYIGLSDEEKEGDFRWVNGADLKYTHWGDNQPDDKNRAQDYVELYPDGRWEDQYMMRPREFVVEVPCYDIELLSAFDRGDFFLCGTYDVEYAVHSVKGSSDTCTYQLQVECPMWMDYCPNRGMRSDRVWLEEATFAGYTIHTGNNNGYWQMTDSVLEVDISKEQLLEITPGGLGRKVYWRAWIDLNRDGDFGRNESVAYGSYLTSMSSTIRIPSGTDLGLAGMRVITSYGKYPSDPCKSVGDGEVEDYFLYFIHSSSKTDFRHDEAKEDKPCGTFSIAPNPAMSYFRLTGLEEVHTVTVFDRMGRKVLQLDTGQLKEAYIDISAWEAGVYTFVLSGNSGVIRTAKAVVVHAY